MIHLNGAEITPTLPCSVGELLAQHGYDPLRVAVERNREIVRRSDYDSVFLSENDEIEVVCFVQGG